MGISPKAALLAALIALPGSAALGASRTYDLPPFTAVDISSGIETEIEVGPAQSVRAESPEEDELGELTVEVRGGWLIARTEWNLFDLFSFGRRRITLFVTVPALVGADASAGARVDVTGMSGEAVSLNSSSGADIDARNAAARTFRIDASSGADIIVEGACTSASIDVSSGATVRATRLECSDVDVDASSGATVSVFASSSLRADASSGASIQVSGNPASVERNESSGGDVDIEN